MIPNFVINGKEISIYLILALIGFFVSGIYACSRFRKKGQSEDLIINFYLVISVGVLLGGHILYGITNFTYLVQLMKKALTFSFDSFSQFILACQVVFGGSVFYGGLLGGLAIGYFYIKKKKLNKDLYVDTVAPCIPLFHTFGRVGCFLSGCCYGIESQFGFVYKHSMIEQANNVRRFPIQLVEAVLNLLLFIVLHKISSSKEQYEKVKGKLLHIYLISYAIIRFVLEFFRGDSYRGILFGISTSQYISLFILIFLLGNAVIYRKRNV